MDDTNIPVYGARMMFSSKQEPNLTKYMLWIDSVHLTDTSCFLHEPFNFDSQSDIISVDQYIALRHWEFLLTSYNKLDIVLLLMFTLATTKPKKKKRK